MAHPTKNKHVRRSIEKARNTVQVVTGLRHGIPPTRTYFLYFLGFLAQHHGLVAAKETA